MGNIKNNKLISIIVPVYNVKQYIRKCLDSLVDQTNDNFEVIVVDDGSTDGSQMIVDEYLDNDKFKIFHKQNCGVSSARNFGLTIAKGDKVLFVDADDECDLNMIKYLQKCDSDLVFFGFKKIYKNEMVDYINSINELCLSKVKNGDFFIDDNISGYLWNKLFDLNLIKENNITFNENITFCEDMFFISDYLNYVNKFEIINKSLYYYRMRKNSTMNNVSNLKNISLFNVYDALCEKYANNHILYNFFSYNYVLCYYKLKKIINKNKVEINKDILLNEKKIIKELNIKTRIKFNLLKYFNNFYSLFVYFKKKNRNLFD